MKYAYKLREVGNDTKCLVMDLPKEIGVVTDFLFSDVQGSSGEFFLNEIDPVLSGKEKRRIVSGNVCVLEIRKRKTKIDCEFANFGKGASCKIETKELKELLLLWVEKNREFKQK